MSDITRVTPFEIVKAEYGQGNLPVHVRPRSLSAISAFMEREFTSFPEIAQSFFYARPVGEGKVATGLSIRAAEFLANYYPNSEYTTEVVRETEDSYEIKATFKDVELNTCHSRLISVSKFFKFKDGRVAKSDPDRMEIRIAAATSKALREVIIRSMPVCLKIYIERRAKEIISKTMMAPEAIGKLIESFKVFGIEQKHLEKILDKPISKMDTEDRVFMLALFNSISDGDMNANELVKIVTNPKIRNVRMAISDMMTGNPITEDEKPAQPTVEKAVSDPKPVLHQQPIPPAAAAAEEPPKKKTGRPTKAEQEAKAKEIVESKAEEAKPVANDQPMTYGEADPTDYNF